MARAASASSSRRQRATVAERAEILGRVETVGGGCAKAADRTPFAGRQVRLAAVFDDGEVVARGDLGDGAHVGRLTVEVHRHDRRSVRRHGRGRCVRIERQAIGIDVGKNGAGARHHDRERRVRGRERRRDHLIARPDAKRAQRDRQRIGAGADAYGVGRLTGGRELVFESFELRTENEPAARDDARDGVADDRLRPRLASTAGT